MRRATPITAPFELLECGDDEVRATARVDATDPVFAGHYPGFPMLPGVYLLELVDGTVRIWRGSRHPVELATLDRCRFHSPVYPGEDITIRAALRPTDDGLSCSASVSTARGPAADLRLHYRMQADR